MLSTVNLRGLQTKIFAWSFVPTAIILGAVGLLTFFAYRQVTEDLVMQRNQERSRLSAGQMAVELTKYTTILTNEARVASLRASSNLTRQAALARAANRLAVFDAGVVLLNTRGAVSAAYPERPESSPTDWSGQAFFQEMLHYPDATFSNIVPLGPGGSDVIAVAVPIIGELGEFNGVLVGQFNLGATSISALYGDIVKLRIENTCCAIIVDGNGRAIYHTDSARVGEDFSGLEVVQLALAGANGAVRTGDIDNRDSVASYAPIPGTTWAVITQESWETLMQAGEGYRRFLLALLGLGVVLPGLVGALGVRRIIHPIRDLIAAAQEVAAGNLNQTITAHTGDEIETLAGQFNVMSVRLQESYALLEKRVAERTRELATLNAIAAVVSQSLNLEEILRDALRETLAALAIEAGGIYVLREESAFLTLDCAQGLPDALVEDIRHLPVSQSYFTQIVATGEPVFLRDLSESRRPHTARMVEEGFHSAFLFGLASRGQAFGVLFVLTREPRDFSEQDVALLTSIARQIGVATQNARLYTAEQRRADQFRTINEVGRQIAALLDVDDLLQQIVQLLQETIGYYVVTIGLVEDGMLVFKAGRSKSAADNRFFPPPVMVGGQGITAWVAATGETLLVPDVTMEPRFLLWPETPTTRSELAIPLKTKAGVIGVLNVESEHINAFDESDLNVLQAIAQQAAIAIENARLFEQAQQLAVIQERQRLARDLHDSVTQGLYGVTLYAEAAARQLLRDEPDQVMAAAHLRELQATAQEALREMRLLIFELRPPILENEGLIAALQARLETVEGRSGINTLFTVEGEVGRLPARTESGLYRIAQEVLNNTLKHADAHHITVTLRQTEGSVILEISDDGLGFEVDAARKLGGMGLPGMEERAVELGGRLVITSHPGEGTAVRIEVPR